jgi:hypothetical protein
LPNSTRISAARARPSRTVAATAQAVRSKESADLERVRSVVFLGERFSSADFEAAFNGFRSLYNVLPDRIVCSPDALYRYCDLFGVSENEARHSDLRYHGILVAAGILPPGTVAIEGEIDPDRMGDW